jgi:hypothetical protein
MPTVTFGTGTGLLADAWVRHQDTTWPPTTETTNTTATAPSCNKNFTTPNYQVTQFLFAWDTSSIPDDATITAAELRLFVTGKSQVDGLTVGARYHNTWDLNPAGDYSLSPTSDAFTGVTIASLTTNADNALTLLNPTSVNKAGNTALHVYIQGTTAPTGSNTFTARFSEDATASGDEPRLVVTYTEAGGTPHARTPSDSVGATDTPAKTQGHFRQTGAMLASSTQEINALSSLSIFGSLAQEGVTLTDNVTVSGAESVQLSQSENVSIADSAPRIAAFKRAPQDSVSLSDSTTPTVVGGGNRQVADSLTVTDTQARVVTYRRNATEALALTDSATRVGAQLNLTMPPEVLVYLLEVPSAEATLLSTPGA